MKKHKVKINIVDSGQPVPEQSSFVVNLKPAHAANPKLASDHFGSANHSADFLASAQKKPKSELLNFQSDKLKQMLFYPFFRLLFHLFRFFRQAFQTIKIPRIKFKFPFGDRVRLVKIKLPRVRINIPRIKIKSPLWKIKRRAPEPKIVAEALNLIQPIIPEKIIEIEEDPETKRSRWRSIWSFILVLLIIIIPFKVLTYYQILNLSSWQDSLVGRSKAGIDRMMMASESAGSLNLGGASQNFSQAGVDFVQAQEQLKEIDELVFALAAVSGNEKYQLASQSKKLLAAGEISARLGGNLTLAVDSLVGSGQSNEKIAPRIDNFVLYGRSAIADTQELNEVLATVKVKSLPAEYQAKFTDLKEKSVILEKGLSNFVNLAVGLDEFLGANMDKRYLLIFQNNNELRASGGFVGSYALIDLRDGQIKNLEVPGGGSYDTAGGLRVLMAAPQPLWLVNPLWHFWDANWWPDWELSAKNLMWFLEKSDGPSVDGVIAFTPTVIERLLLVTGPIDMTEKYGVTITSDNFWEVTQGIIEKTGNPEDYAAATSLGKKLSPAVKAAAEILATKEKEKPKAIIGDLMNRILEELPKKLDKQSLLRLLQTADEDLNEKQVMFYFTDAKLQQKMIDNSWAGKIKSAPNDYLSVVNTNIAGAKSDRVVEESIQHQIEVQADGYIIDNLIITRAHRGLRGDAFTGVRNVDWMRIYVPQGSELLETSGWSAPDAKYFESPDPAWEKNKTVAETEDQATVHVPSGTKIYAESGKTVFANWSMVDPGKNTIITLKYRLPFKLKRQAPQTGLIARINRLFHQEPVVYDYSLLVQKQPGAKASDYSSSLAVSNFGQIFWKYPDNLGIMDNGWKIQEPLNSDKYYKILLK